MEASSCRSNGDTDHASAEASLISRGSLLASLPFPLFHRCFIVLPLPAFVSSSETVKALACQTAIIGGGAGFSLYFPCATTEGKSFLVSLSAHKGWFQRPEGYYYPDTLEAMPLGSDRLEAFYAFQEELNAMLFPLFIEAFPLAESLGHRFLSSCLAYDRRYESRKAWLSLPARKEAA